MSSFLLNYRNKALDASKKILHTRFVPAVFICLLVAGLLSSTLYALPQSAGYNQSSVFGQNHLDGSMDFDSRFPYNFRVPNPVGFYYPQGALVDEADQRLFVSDTQNGRVVVYPLDGNNNPTTTQATAVIGRPNLHIGNPYHYTDGTVTPTANTFSTRTQGLAYIEDKKLLFVADQGANRILVFDLTNGIQENMNASYVIGQTNFTDTSAAVTASNFNSLRNLFWDETEQRLYAADQARILVFDLSGGIQNGMAASNVLGQPNFTTMQDPGWNATPSTMRYATDVFFLPSTKQLFVTDNYRVLVFDLSGGIQNGMAASNVLGQKNLYEYQTSNHQSFQDRMNSPLSLEYIPSHNMLAVGDGQFRIMLFDIASGIQNGMPASNVIGRTDFTNSQPVDNQQRLCFPYSLQLDSKNDLWVPSMCDNRILRFNMDTIVNAPSSNLVIGQRNHNGQVTYDQSQSDSFFIQPQGFTYPMTQAIDEENHLLFVGDMSERLMVYQLDENNSLESATPKYVLGQDGFYENKYPQFETTPQNRAGDVGSIQYDPVHKRLFVMQAAYPSLMGSAYISVFDLSNGITNNMKASYIIGRSGFDDMEHEFWQPRDDRFAHGHSMEMGMDYDVENERLFVADNHFGRVMVFDFKNGIQNGMPASNVIGQPDFTTRNYPFDQNTLSGPVDVSYDSVGKRLFVPDMGACRVLVYDLSGGIQNGMPASNVIGATDYTTNLTCENSETTFQVPTIAEYDETRQQLYVGGLWTSRLSVFDLKNGIQNGMPVSAVLGEPSKQQDADKRVYTSRQSLFEPTDLTVDKEGSRLIVADSANNRIVSYRFIRLVDIPNNIVREGQQVVFDITQNHQGTVSFTILEGELPPGLTIDPATGQLVGTPSKPGNYTFKLRVTDDNGPIGTFTDEREYTLAVHSKDTPIVPPVIDGIEQPAGEGGNPVFRAVPFALATPVQEGKDPDSCLEVINLDDKEAYNNGSGYEVEVNNCYVLYFSETNDSGEQTVYGLSVNYANNDVVNMTLAEQQHFTSPIASGNVVPGEQRVVLRPSAGSGSAVAVAVTELPPGTPNATLKLAKVKPTEAYTPPYNWLNWIPVTFIALSGGTVLYFAVRKHRHKFSGDNAWISKGREL